MSESKHTAGPWLIYRVKDGPNKGKILGIGDAEGSGIVPDLWRSGAEYEANTRLIAAAPDLLEHAQADIDELEYYVNNPSAWDSFDDGISEKLRAVVTRARAAIAKATAQ